MMSCNRIKNKGLEVINKTEEKVIDKSNKILDEVSPKFDAYNQDTKFNKIRFKDFLKIELTPDVKNIYCFEDAVGIDSDYMFSFNCNSKTADKIKEKHSLRLDKNTKDYAFGLQNDFKWWDKEEIKMLELYSWHEKNNYFKYFWYDEEKEKAYYFEFDL